MRRALVVMLALPFVLAACGAVERDRAGEEQEAGGVHALGMSIDPPPGWHVRIVLGARRRPVLHAANFRLPSNDDDSGAIARETFGGADLAYLNVQEVATSDAPQPLPVHFAADDFRVPESGCCRIATVSRDVEARGRTYRVSASIGGRDPPDSETLAEANRALATLGLEPYRLLPAEPLPAGARRVESRGVAFSLPDDWDGRAKRGELDAAGDGLRLRLVEHGGSDAPFVTGAAPIELNPAEFVEDYGGGRISGRSFVDAGREFVLWVEGAPTPEALADANALLATLRVEPGDFYPGTVDPATFAPAPGWHTGSSGPDEVEPSGQQTFTWASTVRYLDEPAQFPPHKTKLGPDDVFIWVSLSEWPGQTDHGSASPPFRLAAAERDEDWEGQIDDLPRYRIRGRMNAETYDVDVHILFGRPHPSPEQLATADAELARLRLPDWPRR